MKPRLTLLTAFIAAAVATTTPASAEITEAQALAQYHLADIVRLVAHERYDSAAAEWWIVENQLLATTQRYTLDYWPTFGPNITIEQLLDNPPPAPGAAQLLTAAGDDLTNAAEQLDRGEFWFMVACQAMSLHDWEMAHDFFQLAQLKLDQAATNASHARANLEAAQLQIDTANDLMTAALNF